MKKVVFLLVGLAFVTGAVHAAGRAPVTDGAYRTYYPSGALQKEEHYRNKELSGQASEFYENGKMKSTVGYVANQREGVGETYYETGVLKSRGTYKKGALEGDYREYDKNGNLSAERTYKDGVLQGIAKTYYSSGAVSKQMYYKKAVVDGTAVEFSEDGRPTAEESYQNGILIERRDISVADNLASKAVVPAVRKEAGVSVKTEFAGEAGQQEIK